MRAREYLGGARDAERMLVAEMAEAAGLCALVRVAGALAERCAAPQTAGARRQLEAACVRVERAVGELVDSKARVRGVVDLVRDPDERALLRLRYLSGMKWEEVARAMHYTERQVYRIHRRALLAVEALLS